MKHLIHLFLLISFVSFNANAITFSGKVEKIEGQEQHSLQNHSVFLHIFDRDKEIATAQTKTTKNGTYSFNITDAKDLWVYQVRIPFEGLDFYSDYLTKNQPKIPLITVSKATYKPDDIDLSEIVFIEFSKNADLAKITHQLQFTNKGSLTYHPKENDPTSAIALGLIKGGFSLSLIENITRHEVQVQEEESLIKIYKTIEPGQSVDIRFSYMYPLEKRTIQYDRTANINQQSLHFIFNKKSVTIPGDDATSMDLPSEFQSTFKKAYQFKPMHHEMSIVIKGFYRKKDVPILYALGGSLLIVLLFIVLWMRHKKHYFEDTQQSIMNEIQHVQQSDLQEAEKQKKIELLKTKLFYTKMKK